MKVKAIAIAALFSVALPTAVLAQANTTGAGTVQSQTGIDAGASAGGSTGSMGTSGGVNADLDFNAFLQGFEGADFTNATSGFDTAASFNVVKLSTLQNADATKLQSVLGSHEQDIAGLSGRIGANTQAMAALDAQGLSASDVVWAESGNDGMWTLYVNDLGSAGASGAASGSTGATTTQ